MARSKKTIPVRVQKKAKSKGKKSNEVASTLNLPSVQDLRNEIDRVFENFGWGLWGSPARRAGTSIASIFPHNAGLGQMPVVDFSENDKSYNITAELPGMEEKDIEVELSDSMLTISGEKKEEKKEGYYLSERSYGSFERRLQVPHGVDTSKISATFKNGILTVALPKVAKTKKTKKRISVTGK